MTLTRSSTALRGGTVFKNTVPRTIAAPSVHTHEPVRVSDRRYKSPRWRRVRLRVLARDAYRCRIVPGCDAHANVADHIQPVYPGMPDSLFFDPRNLRAGCRRHNVARGFASLLTDAG